MNRRSLFAQVRSKLTRWRRRRACGSIRDHLAWFGFPSDATDEEIEAGCLAFESAMRQTGVSAAEAFSALRVIADFGGPT